MRSVVQRGSRLCCAAAKIPARCLATSSKHVQTAYAAAKERYAAIGVDTDAAIAKALAVPISMHCWQADDVVGFLHTKQKSGGGIMATGGYPGRARTGDEARADYDKVLSLAPGKHRLNLHACYAETRTEVDMDELQPEHFRSWMDYAASRKLCLDFNPTFFAHPKAADGYTLSHVNPAIRQFWVQHGIACRHIAVAMARGQNEPCVANHWIPDGDKDLPSNRWLRRELLTQSLDQVLVQPQIDRKQCLDFVEPKLFGIGSEEYVVGSAEYYSNYALSRKVGLCLDMGHFHPTETIHDKVSSHMQFHDKLLIHVSRPIRWDSDHVVIFNDDLKSLFAEIHRGNAWSRVCVALDFFDASINRVAAYVIGLRASRKAVLLAMLEPASKLKELETSGDRTARLVTLEDLKSMPFVAVWDQLCAQQSKLLDGEWLSEIKAYEKDVQSKRA